MESVQGLNEEEHATKRLKTGVVGWDSSIARTAEIALFLSGMAQMRGGRVPSFIERGLMDEARQRLGRMAAMLVPGDLILEDFARDMVGDLGFNRNEETAGNLTAATLGEKFAERKAELETRIEKVHQLAATATIATSSHTVLEQTARRVQPYQIKTPFLKATSSPIGYPLALVDQRTRSRKPNDVSSSIPEASLSPSTSRATPEAERTVLAWLDQASPFPMDPRFQTEHPMAPFAQKMRMAHSGGATLPISVASVAAMLVASQAQTFTIPRLDQVALSVPVPQMSLASPVTVIAQTTTVAQPDQMTPSISMVLASPVDHTIALLEHTTRMVQSDGMPSSLPMASRAPILHQGTTTAQGTIEAQSGQTTVTDPFCLSGNMSGQKSVLLSTELFARDQSRASTSSPADVSFPHQISLTSSVTFGNNHGMFGSSITSLPVGPVNSLSAQSQGPSETELFGRMNDHDAIARAVKQVLQSLSSERTESQPPSRSYMNTQLPCQICKAIVNDVSSVLICDWCEKVFHISCHQPYPVKGIPKSEWYCSKCFAASKGKPYPMKYGRIGKHTAFQTSSANKGSLEGASVKIPAKVENSHLKPQQPKV